MKLKIKNQSSQESERILKILWKILRENNPQRQCDPVHCNTTIEDEVTFYCNLNKIDKTIRKLALHIYGNTLDATIIKTAELTIIGDGECPKCGSNYVKGDYYRICEICDHSWYVEAESRI